MKKSIYPLTLVLIITFANLLINTSLFGQAPEAFTYQAIVRDVMGNPLADTSISFQFNILQGSATGTTIYSENQSTTTNGFGLVNLQIGQGTVNTGTFSTIDWGNDAFFLNIQIDQGSGFVDMGTQQFISVPYALYAKSAGNGGTTYTAGNGISITGNVIENTAPDQTVTITGGGATSVTGTYPNFTISSTDNVDDADADNTNELQTLSQVLQEGNNAGTYNIDMNNQNITNAHILGLGSSNSNYIDMYWGNIRDYNDSHGINGQVLTVHGTSPNTYVTWDTPNVNDADSDPTNEIQTLSVTGNQLSISGSGGNTVTMQVAAAGNTGDVQLNDNGSIGADPDLHWDFANKKFTVGQSTDDGRMIIQQDANASDSIPILEVKNKLGQTIFVVYPDSVHIFIDDDNTKGVLKGGFAVSGRSGTKAVTNDFLLVRPDSTRIWTTDPEAGFGVRDLSSGTETGYMHINPDNYFIGENSGENLTTGLYNSTFGYQSGEALTSGSRNVFLGYQAGLNNSTANENNFIGYQAGNSNTSGIRNNFIGYQAGYSNTTGNRNTFIGTYAGRANVSGSYNTCLGHYSAASATLNSYNSFIGTYSGRYANVSDRNNFFGYYAGAYSNNSADNVYIGYYSGYSADSSTNSIAIGTNSARNNRGNANIALGYRSMYSNIIGNNNICLGDSAGLNNNTDNNIFIGVESGLNNTSGTNNVMMGYKAGYTNDNGTKNIFIGNNAGYSNSSGTQIICIGDNAGQSNTASNNIFIGAEAGMNNQNAGNNIFIGNQAGKMNTTGAGNAYFGWGAGVNNNGSNNVMIGFWSGLLANTASENIFIGQGAGETNDGIGNIFLGYVTTAATDNSIYIGNQISTNRNNTLIIDGDGGTRLIYGEFDNSRLGINTTSPTANLHIKQVGVGEEGLTIENDGNTNTWSWEVGTNDLNLSFNGGNVGYWDDATGNYNTTSDKRLKKDITPIDKDILNNILKLKPVSYRLNDADENSQKAIGFIAQDIQKYFPELVYKRENGYLSLHYSDFGVYAIKAIQEQQKIIDNQNKKIDGLMKRIEALEKKN